MLIGCTPITDPDEEKFPDDLFGVWVSNVVPVSGYGYFDGIATHTYNEDGTYTAEIDFVDPSSNCRAVIDYTGTFTGQVGSFDATPDGGSVTISSCDDATLNQASTAHSAATLTASMSTVQYVVDGNTLILTHSDGLQRIYRRQ